MHNFFVKPVRAQTLVNEWIGTCSAQLRPASCVVRNFALKQATIEYKHTVQTWRLHEILEEWTQLLPSSGNDAGYRKLQKASPEDEKTLSQ